MAVARLGVGAGGSSTGAAVTFNGPSLATSDANTVMIVGVVISVSSNSTATTCAVTCGGVAMTQSNLTLVGTSTNRAAVGLYYLFNPGTGIKSVVVTPGGASTKAGVQTQAVAFSGAGAVGAAETAAATSHSPASVANGYDVRVLSNGATLSTPNQTQERLAGATVSGVGDWMCMQTAAGTGSAIAFTCSGTATTPQSVAVAISPPLPKFSTLSDPLTSAAGWTLGAAGSVSGGQVVLAANASYTGSALYNSFYDLVGSSVYMKVSQLGPDTYFQLDIDGGNQTFLRMNTNGTSLVTQQGSAGSVAESFTGSYNATNHRWWRISESGGNILWDTSPDSVTWTNFHTAAAAITVSSLKLFLLNGGTGSNAIFESLNTSGGSYTGSASTTATAGLTAAGVVAVSGQGTLSAAATIAGAGVVGKVSSGALAATATTTGAGAAAIPGTGTPVTATAAITGVGAAGAGGNGSLTATATITGAVLVAATTSGSAATAATVTGTGVVAIVGAGSALAATATVAGAGPVGLAATAAPLTVTATTSGAGGAAGAGNFTATATVTGSGVVGVAKTASPLTATATITATGAVAGSGTRSTTATITGTGVAAISSAGSLTATATVTGSGVVAVVGSGSLTATAAIQASATGAVNGTGSRTTTATITGLGVVAVVGSGALTATATTTGVPATQGAAAATTAATITGTGFVARIGAGSLTVTATATGSGAVPGSGALTTTATIGGAGTAAGTGSFTSTATVTGSGVVGVVGTGSITVLAVIPAAATVDTFGAGSLTATAAATGAGVSVPLFGPPPPDRVITAQFDDRSVTAAVENRAVTAAIEGRTVHPLVEPRTVTAVSVERRAMAEIT